MNQPARPAYGNVMLSVSGRGSAPTLAPMPAATGMPPMDPGYFHGMPMPVVGAWPQMPIGQPTLIDNMTANAMNVVPAVHPGLTNVSMPDQLPPSAPPSLDSAFAQLLRKLGSLGPNQSQMLASVASFVGEHFGAGSESQQAVMDWASRLDSRPGEVYERGPVAMPQEQSNTSLGFRPWIVGRVSA